MSIAYSRSPDSRTAVVSEATPTARLAEKQRMEGIDVCRFVASTGVIWLHSCTIEEWARIGRFRMPFFTMLAAFLVALSIYRRPNRSTLEYLRGRGKRILLPYAVWSAIYASIFIGGAVLLKQPVHDYLHWDTLICGGAFHLWFLPFIFVVSVIAFGMAKMTATCSEQAAIGFSIGFTALGLVASLIVSIWMPDIHDQDQFWWWMGHLPLMPIGVALALFYRQHPQCITDVKYRRVGLMVGTFFWIAFVAIDTLPLGIHWMCGNIAGIGFLYASLCLPSYRWLKPLAWLGTLAYGTYLAHYLFLRPWSLLDHGRPGWDTSFTRFLSAMIGATLLSFVLGRIKWTRWMV